MDTFDSTRFDNRPEEGAAAMRVIQCDVVVVGGGGAGTYAALRLHDLGLKPMLISKGLVGKSGASIMAGAVIVGSKMLGGTDQNAAASLEFFAKYYSHFLVDQSYLAAAGHWIENTFYPEMESLGLLFSREADGQIAMSHSPVRWAVAPCRDRLAFCSWTSGASNCKREAFRCMRSVWSRRCCATRMAKSVA